MTTPTALDEKIRAQEAFVDTIRREQLDPALAELKQLTFDRTKLDYPFEDGDLLENEDGTRRFFFAGLQYTAAGWKAVCHKVKNDGNPYANTCDLEYSWSKKFNWKVVPKDEV